MSSSSSVFSSASSIRRRHRVAHATVRQAAFASAVLSSLCAGSVAVFSLYGHIFQERLGYSQFQVNGVAIAASIACYLPVPLLGYACDRAGPAPLSLLSAVLFGVGYGLAASLYRRAASALLDVDRDSPLYLDGPSTPAYVLMLVAFVIIGIATCAMYLSAVATCAKNFGRGRHRGLALAVPIAAYGLSGMWQSQLASRLLYERLPPLQPGGPVRRGDVDVFVFFLFLAILLAVVGLVGSMLLRVVDEDELIDEAADELERSGLLDSSILFAPSAGPAGLTSSDRLSGPSTASGYGTISRADPFGHGRNDDGASINDDEDEDASHRLLDPTKDVDDEEAEAEQRAHRDKKRSVLNAETRRFLSDHTMWLFAVGFFFMIGPGEAFINNMGTVLKTLQPPPVDHPASAATHVSIVALVGTIVRLLTGSLTDLLAPRPQTSHLQPGSTAPLLSPSSSRPVTPTTSASSLADADDYADANGGSGSPVGPPAGLPSVSRVSFLLTFALIMSAGLALLASGLMQDHADRFWLVSALIGAGYGAVFSLTPIIITVIWGVENFGTNWGIVAMFPALGATVWGLIYSAVYQAGAGRSAPGAGPGAGRLCYGTQCYATTFWAMSASVWLACALVLLAWKGRGGWTQRGIVI